jgi:hypothetical protein
MGVRLVSIPRQSELAYEPSDWAGALVVVEAGEVELECASGARACFATGSVLFFDGLGLRAVRNAGCEPALLSATTRRCQQSSAQRRIYATSEASRSEEEETSMKRVVIQDKSSPTKRHATRGS